VNELAAAEARRELESRHRLQMSDSKGRDRIEALYHEALPLAGRIYLTRVAGQFEADTYFPPLDTKEWQEKQRVHRPADERNACACDFSLLERTGRSMSSFS